MQRVRFASVLAVWCAAACSARVSEPAPAVGTAIIPTAWEYTGKAAPVTSTQAMVVSGHPLASEAGVEVLRAGGNAIDAAVAVGMALAVTLPAAGNIGGGGFLIYREAKGKVHALDYRETAPGRAHRDMYLNEEGELTEQSLTGHLAAGVPGSVAGMWEMHQKFGRLPWRQLLGPALRLADEGHLIDSVRSLSLENATPRLREFPASRRQFLVNDEAPEQGTWWTQPDLAKTLRLIADSGPTVFYEGSIADLIAAEMERGEGLITKDDLAGYRTIWRKPIEIKYRGHRIYSMPPSSSGGVTMALILHILEGFKPLPAFGSAELIHLESEAMRRAFTDRNTYLGDPDFVDMPLRRLLSKRYAARLRREILPNRATPTPALAPSSREGNHTTHYSIIDAEGNAASITTTINDGFGSAVTVTGAGFLLNNEMDDFAAAPGEPNLYGLVQGEANAIQPGKRMLSSMSPSIVLDRDKKLFMVVGSPGGPRIITAVYHVISNVIDHRMPLGDAVSAPRIHHQALPDSIRIEPSGIDSIQASRLRTMGHGLMMGGLVGEISAIMRTANGWVGVADPRRGGGARGY